MVLDSQSAWLTWLETERLYFLLYLPLTTRYPGISGPRRTVQTWPGLAALTSGSFILSPAVTNVRADAESTILTLRKTDGYK